MGFFNRSSNVNENTQTSTNEIGDDNYLSLLIELASTKSAIETLAIEKAIDMIAKVIAKCEFVVVRKNKEGKFEDVKDDVYYRLNILANPNQTGTEFWKEVMRTYFRQNEALIVILDSGMYLANSFVVDEAVFYERTYSNIQIDNLMLKRNFKASEVIHLKCKNQKIENLVTKANELYSNLVEIAESGYRVANAKKFSLKIPGQVSIQGQDGKPLTQNEYAKSIEDQLTSKETKVILSAVGINLDEIKSDGKSQIEDVTKLENAIIENVAFIFDIPIDVFIGKTTEKSNAMNDFITFAISSVIEDIDDSINARVVTKKEFLSGAMIYIDKSRIKHVDVIESATNIDKLYADGFSHNNIRKLIGWHRLDEEWADEHNVTKNYGNVSGGGETSEQKK